MASSREALHRLIDETSEADLRAAMLLAGEVVRGTQGRQGGEAALPKESDVTRDRFVNIVTAMLASYLADPAKFEGIDLASDVDLIHFSGEGTYIAIQVKRRPNLDDPGSADAAPMDEDRAWLNATLVDELEPYDWGPGGEPVGQPVRWDAARGEFVAVEGS